MANRRLHGVSGLQPELLREVRYPYYDRDLLEFMYAIPREQIVRVGQRRFLMKRALVGIVPARTPEQKAKGVCAARVAKKDSSTEWPSLVE